MSHPLKNKALILSYFTVGYNILEGLVSIAAGALTGSVSLVGFGFDSFIESISGSVMIWRFSAKIKDEEHEEEIERKASKFVGYSFFVLGAYILFESVKKLYLHIGPEPSILGIIIAALSLIVMPFLAHLKYKTGKSMKSRSLVADSKQTFVCVLMSIALLLGTGINFLFGFWWADAVTGLIFVFLCVKEGHESIQEGKLCCH